MSKVNKFIRLKIESVALLHFLRFYLFRLTSLDVPSVPYIFHSEICLNYIVHCLWKKFVPNGVVCLPILMYVFRFFFFWFDVLLFDLLKQWIKNVNMHRVHYGSRDDHTFSWQWCDQYITIGYDVRGWKEVTSSKTIRLAYWMKWTIHHPKVVIQFLTHFGHITNDAQWFFKMIPFFCICLFFHQVFFLLFFSLLLEKNE